MEMEVKNSNTAEERNAILSTVMVVSRKSSVVLSICCVCSEVRLKRRKVSKPRKRSKNCALKRERVAIFFWLLSAAAIPTRIIKTGTSGAVTIKISPAAQLSGNTAIKITIGTMVDKLCCGKKRA